MEKQNMTIDEAFEQTRKDFEDLFEKLEAANMTENKEPDFDTLLVKKCLDIVRNNKKVVVIENVGIYTVRKWKFFGLNPWNDIFDIQNCTDCLPKEYWLTINGVDHHIPINTPGVKELYDICAQKYYEKTQQRENAALNFLDDYVTKKQENKVGLWKRVFGRQR